MPLRQWRQESGNAHTHTVNFILFYLGGGGNIPFCLIFPLPKRMQQMQTPRKTAAPAARGMRQFVREMTFLMGNTCWRRTKGLVWLEGCSWFSSEVPEKVISLKHQTPSSWVSWGSRCCPGRCGTNGTLSHQIKGRKESAREFWQAWAFQSISLQEKREEGSSRNRIHLWGTEKKINFNCSS